MSPLADQRILLGVCGGIAAYKAAELVRRLRERAAEVQVVLTGSAGHFVGEATFQALSGRPVRSSLWDAQAEAAMGHIELARWATAVVVAPASANTLAKLANGLADDLLGTLVLASRAPLWLAPAMNQAMWAHPATQANIERLRQRGAQVIGPGVGDQACGDVGAGRMSEPMEIVAALETPGSGRLAGRHVLVSAGPTYEDLDPVRYLGNRSSGRMGFAIAGRAAALGASVTLVAGPVALPTPAGVRRTDVRSAAQMRDAVLAAAGSADVYIGAAAVADYRPRLLAADKIKKTQDSLTLELERTPDILGELGSRRQRPMLVGFAAETGDVESYARDKLARKNLDLIAANHVGEGKGFEVADNALVVYAADGAVIDLGEADKTELAARLLDVVVDRLVEKDGRA
ncbi:bifunctional phosphopantothenoylcysteine decarboxylase/phosphopantothenate--cysteine ligase CoaBC [Pseudofulvimonas gallinarii]|uniref:Coenzyme A biosynthesis bifunctional protein CoaBC n=1 Tax=Pseudofulvimonas gallinarii TaxID=634155 RepID=A0A4R3LFX8_9GAMM|nr:bifunctional phosphopantothenoylcysteine decarboxylase/phosphopantothenate--cysteine ligase CoaBC [Pseudofulvimonas gallinarii]TCS98430.1 phosphopantothenate-cysteine ligase /phosphopantothenoylcysteine decarboxylase [Pseudofulvimonas gallinarii]THD13764.1 bifunctional 4'-phosphopantothenoylcysteine decarboxylase/phosphopantothenoylcysteine synthetase [Pseudofulvimonas gallinarii]